MAGWLTRTGVGVLVVAALAGGRAVTEAMPLTPEGSRMAAEPFVTEGRAGEPVDLRWAQVEVVGVRQAAAIETTPLIGTPGVFVVVDLRVVAKGEPRSLGMLHLVDADGRRYGPDPRTGSPYPTAPTGVDRYVSTAFEVPAERLAGLRLEVAQGADPWWDNRRDEIGRIDLGIATDDVERFTTTRDIVPDLVTGPTPPPTDPVGTLDP